MRQLFVLIIALVTGFASFSQSKKNNSVSPILADVGIKSITAFDNIDLLLFNSHSDNVEVRLARDDRDKVRLYYSDGNLQVSLKNGEADDKRIVVYVWVNDLESVTLKGDAAIFSKEVLNLSSLQVNVKNSGKIALRTKGKIRVNAPETYQFRQEEKSSTVITGM